MANAPGHACPRCGAPRAPGPECPRCRVIYAKARPRPAPATPLPDAPQPDLGAEGVALGMPPPARWSGALDGARRELWIRAVAPPAALLLALALVASGPGHALLRTFLSMWIHELGHATAAWLCGHGAFPGPWRTPISAARLPLVVVAVAGGLAALAWRGWRTGRRALLAAGLAGLAVQLVCTALPATTARALITFGGDAGCMVIGAALVATIWSDPEGPLGRGSLRWGFLAIGAAALVDALHAWVRAWRDPGELPLGEIEGVGLSDASTLMQVHRWSASALSGRYVTLGLACLAALGAVYAVMLARARAAVAGEARRGISR
ncbi:conserved hypothetical protein [Anaeromyxobacter sp. K]|uniref:hypothetical protein n=1 Tax=Anaeromyxobacter sp. (strain K) TaxID=447217 RepID=UPI00015F9E83|nr:hypothetical protein [Anaeromyxobacter sp. K]ACG74466.1 conserved hypothetical protein [Anaeromyxobacter sp. K]